MDEDVRCSRSVSNKLLKQNFLQALKSNDFVTLENLLAQGKIDVDTVFEVEDENLVLASYKAGYWLPSYKLTSSWATGLHLTVMLGYLESILVLLQHHASINSKPNGKTPLHVACEIGNIECMQILISHGAKLNSFSVGGLAPLHYCTKRESIQCAKELVLSGKMISFDRQIGMVLLLKD
uniref:Uncharacterized protein n=1 Tax=Leptobrachium leishanense TaxID=445787 RepID=A0A8C5MCJ7_9ANUR